MHIGFRDQCKHISETISKMCVEVPKWSPGMLPNPLESRKTISGRRPETPVFQTGLWVAQGMKVSKIVELEFYKYQKMRSQVR